MRVGLFVTCLVDLMRPSIGFAALRLLEAAGCEVVVPPAQTCCGQPGYNSGDQKAAKALALKVIEEFEGCDYVVLPSGSCAGMIRVHYPALFKDNPAVIESIKRLSTRTYELTDFLVNVAKLQNIPGNYSGSLTYHDSCSGLREMGVQAQPRALLARMPGVKLTEMRESTTCCGFGGTFSVKFGEISTRMADNKCEHIDQTGAGAIVAGDLGCLMNIEGRLRRRGDLDTCVLHIAEVLAGEDICK
ncbi:(Fe-S)-binding protein [Sulfuricaulis sp.]|jgi:L-lactate dehydrogenase complex protein LldE|uniref:(Fe-S)-binding protein n=1 Tax=Sulfuricaulis sp. TaxID=2003553 RepID=UPI0035593B4B